MHILVLPLVARICTLPCAAWVQITDPTDAQIVAAFLGHGEREVYTIRSHVRPPPSACLSKLWLPKAQHARVDRRLWHSASTPTDRRTQGRGCYLPFPGM